MILFISQTGISIQSDSLSQNHLKLSLSSCLSRYSAGQIISLDEIEIFFFISKIGFLWILRRGNLPLRSIVCQQHLPRGLNMKLISSKRLLDHNCSPLDERIGYTVQLFQRFELLFKHQWFNNTRFWSTKQSRNSLQPV